MSDDVAYSSASMGATGLAAGAAIGGPIGAVIGLGIGLGAGAFVGKSKRKAKKALKRAQEVQRQREINADRNQFIQMIRQARMARASSASSAFAVGSIGDSLASNAASSIGSQLGYSLDTLAEDRRLFEQYSRYMAKAGRAADRAANASALFSGLADLTMTYAQARDGQNKDGKKGKIASLGNGSSGGGK